MSWLKTDSRGKPCESAVGQRKKNHSKGFEARLEFPRNSYGQTQCEMQETNEDDMSSKWDGNSQWNVKENIQKAYQVLRQGCFGLLSISSSPLLQRNTNQRVNNGANVWLSVLPPAAPVTMISYMSSDKIHSDTLPDRCRGSEGSGGFDTPC